MRGKGTSLFMQRMTKYGLKIPPMHPLKVNVSFIGFLVHKGIEKKLKV